MVLYGIMRGSVGAERKREGKEGQGKEKEKLVLFRAELCGHIQILDRAER